MQSKYYQSGTCNACSKPVNTCACPTTVVVKTSPVTVQDYCPTEVYPKGACVGHCAGIFVSNYDNNTSDPTISNQVTTAGQLPLWTGPNTFCELLNSFSAKDGVTGPQGATGATGPQGAGGTGPQGVRGDVGPEGPRGLQGDIGVTGPQGVIGQDGPRGIQGLTGAEGQEGGQGTQGPKGNDGSEGPDGAQGNPGTQGPQGDQGVLGNTGAIGQDGPQGQRGADGNSYSPDIIGNTTDLAAWTCQPTGQHSFLDVETGLLYFCDDGVRGVGRPFGKGDQGDKGDIGQTGPQGVTGDQGIAGGEGPQGVEGSEGPRGLEGASGPQGAEGPRGNAGITGVQGPIGPQGSQGVRGTQGVVGPEGSVGPEGDTGPQGAAGRRGDTGPQGPQGFGLTGGVGPQGPQGEFGGPAGPQGVTGVDGPQGLPGKDYDPNCDPAVVESVVCADSNGNLGFVFSDETTKYFHVNDFIPTSYSVANAVTNGDGTFSTVNPNSSVITWFSEPTTNVIATDFEKGGMQSNDWQIINYSINHRQTGSCVGKGTYLVHVECDSCNCIVPSFTKNKNGSITINDGKGVVFTVWADGSGGLCGTAPSCDSTSPVASSCSVHPSDAENCGNTVEGAFLRVAKWDCDGADGDCSTGSGYPIGVVEYSGGLYINMVAGNTSKPTVGVAEGSYLGAYDFYSLINKLIELHVDSIIDSRIDARLQFHGLIAAPTPTP